MLIFSKVRPAYACRKLFGSALCSLITIIACYCTVEYRMGCMLRESHHHWAFEKIGTSVSDVFRASTRVRITMLFQVSVTSLQIKILGGTWFCRSAYWISKKGCSVQEQEQTKRFQFSGQHYILFILWTATQMWRLVVHPEEHLDFPMLMLVV